MPEGVFARGGDTKLQEQLGFSPKTPFDGSQCSEFLLEKGPGMRLQNVVVFHNTATVASAWCCAEGIVSVLREMGYNVVDSGNPRLSQIPLMQLRNADLIVVGAPERFAGEVRKHYGSVWNTLRAKKRFGMQSRFIETIKISISIRFATSPIFSRRGISRDDVSQARGIYRQRRLPYRPHSVCFVI
jgi:hypothetical protein